MFENKVSHVKNEEKRFKAGEYLWCDLYLNNKMRITGKYKYYGRMR